MNQWGGGGACLCVKNVCMHRCALVCMCVCISAFPSCMLVSSHRESVCVRVFVSMCVCVYVAIRSRPLTGRSHGQLKCPGANQGKEYFISPLSLCIQKYTLAHKLKLI